jgi:hypothetical protein
MNRIKSKHQSAAELSSFHRWLSTATRESQRHLRTQSSKSWRVFTIIYNYFSEKIIKVKSKEVKELMEMNDMPQELVHMGFRMLHWQYEGVDNPEILPDGESEEEEEEDE